MLETLAVAAVLGRSVRDVLVDVVRIGGDTDTIAIAAVAGGAARGRLGVEAVPAEWGDKLLHSPCVMGTAPARITTTKYIHRYGWLVIFDHAPVKSLTTTLGEPKRCGLQIIQLRGGGGC